MKMLFVLSLFVLALPGMANAGLNLKCGDSYQGTNGVFIVIGGMSLDCVDKDNNNYAVDMMGPGLGGLISIIDMYEDNIRINCPFVNKKRLLKGKDLHMIAPKVEAGLFAGGLLGLAVGHRGAVCSIVGISSTFGAGVTINYLNIHHGTDHKYVLEME